MARPAINSTIFAISSGAILSSMMMSAPASKASATCAGVSASTSIFMVWGMAARALATAVLMSTKVRWLSLISTASSSPKRWFCRRLPSQHIFPNFATGGGFSGVSEFCLVKGGNELCPAPGAGGYAAEVLHYVQGNPLPRIGKVRAGPDTTAATVPAGT